MEGRSTPDRLLRGHISIIRACLLGVLAIGGAAHAAPLKSQELEIKLSAEVLVANSIEIETDGWKLTDEQPIQWGGDQQKFESLKLKVTAKSAVGKVRVKFADAVQSRLVHEKDADAYFKVSAKVGGLDVGTEPGLSLIRSWLLAQLYARGFPPGVWMPGEHTLALRRQISCRPSWWDGAHS